MSEPPSGGGPPSKRDVRTNTVTTATSTPRSRHAEEARSGSTCNNNNRTPERNVINITRTEQEQGYPRNDTSDEDGQSPTIIEIGLPHFNSPGLNNNDIHHCHHRYVLPSPNATYTYPSPLPTPNSHLGSADGQSSPKESPPLPRSPNPLQLPPIPKSSSSPRRKPSANGPAYFGDFSRVMFVRVYALFLERTTRHDKTSPHCKDPLSVFFSVSTPPISIHGYVQRLVTYTHCSPSVFIVALVFMERLGLRHPVLTPSLVNLHRILIAAVTIAVKLLDDRTFSIAHYARVGGVPSKDEMVRLEVAFSKFMNYNTFITFDEYNGMLDKLRPLHDQLREMSDGLRDELLSLDRDDAQDKVESSGATTGATIGAATAVTSNRDRRHAVGGMEEDVEEDVEAYVEENYSESSRCGANNEGGNSRAWKSNNGCEDRKDASCDSKRSRDAMGGARASEGRSPRKRTTFLTDSTERGRGKGAPR